MQPGMRPKNPVANALCTYAVAAPALCVPSRCAARKARSSSRRSDSFLVSTRRDMMLSMSKHVTFRPPSLMFLSTCAAAASSSNSKSFMVATTSLNITAPPESLRSHPRDANVRPSGFNGNNGVGTVRCTTHMRCPLTTKKGGPPSSEANSHGKCASRFFLPRASVPYTSTSQVCKRSSQDDIQAASVACKRPRLRSGGKMLPQPATAASSAPYRCAICAMVAADDLSQPCKCCGNMMYLKAHTHLPQSYFAV